MLRRLALDACRRPWALLAAAVLTGCATLSPLEPAQHLYTGRFSASIDRGEQRETVSGRFTLAVRPADSTLDLASPLGNVLARVHSSAQGATLIAPQPDGSLATLTGDTPEALAEAALGWRLPVSGLTDWIAGRPASGRPSRTEPPQGPALRIEQDGWMVTVDERFEPSGSPRRLTLARDADDAGSATIRMRLVLDAPGNPTEGPAERGER